MQQKFNYKRGFGSEPSLFFLGKMRYAFFTLTKCPRTSQLFTGLNGILTVKKMTCVSGHSLFLICGANTAFVKMACNAVPKRGFSHFLIETPSWAFLIFKICPLRAFQKFCPNSPTWKMQKTLTGQISQFQRGVKSQLPIRQNAHLHKLNFSDRMPLKSTCCGLAIQQEKQCVPHCTPYRFEVGRTQAKFDNFACGLRRFPLKRQPRFCQFMIKADGITALTPSTVFLGLPRAQASTPYAHSVPLPLTLTQLPP